MCACVRECVCVHVCVCACMCVCVLYTNLETTSKCVLLLLHLLSKMTEYSVQHLSQAVDQILSYPSLEYLQF